MPLDVPIRISIDGLQRLTGKFQQMERELPGALEETTKEAVTFVHAHLPKYPPQAADSTYRRTMTLWRTITSFMDTVPDALSRVEAFAGEMQGWVGTQLKYAHWVIDEDDQTEVHSEHGWWRLQEEVAKLKDGIVNVYQKGMDKFVKGIFK